MKLIKCSKGDKCKEKFGQESHCLHASLHEHNNDCYRNCVNFSDVKCIDIQELRKEKLKEINSFCEIENK